MKLYDIYKNKETSELIQISSFATHMNTCDNMLIVFSRLIEIDGSLGSSPSFNSYGTEEEIKKEYELLVPQEKLQNYDSWKEIIKLCHKAKGVTNK